MVFLPKISPSLHVLVFLRCFGMVNLLLKGSRPRRAFLKKIIFTDCRRFTGSSCPNHGM
ncbi:hypothetical protein BJX64DRAFT_129423 [Aspergillus heterothallicus]